MIFLPDTNVWVDYFRARELNVKYHLEENPVDAIFLSAIVLAELRHGAARSARSARNHALIDQLELEIRSAPFDARAARAFGEVRHQLEAIGKVIGPYDMQIAAHALALDAVLVTDNTREFERVEGLRIENWRRA